jgi:hypothetical protein
MRSAFWIVLLAAYVVGILAVLIIKKLPWPLT